MNRGLGHAFLRHVERTRLLLYVLDCSQEPAAVQDALNVLLEEVELHSPGRSLSSSAVLASKMDLVNQDSLFAIEEMAEEHGMPVLQVSAKDGQGVGLLKQQLWEHIEQPKRPLEPESDYEEEGF
eukprot:TRINITY_DN7912_c0_g1_i3.p2 TRINITY_DN7912_c0_g1~~TRINITY_DN7912_c0_g1_i3.p2  ORF type:complete len:125 (+),score=53.34 TRINITY_DN7912_c0_g1_i3:896-1270(+)